MAFEEDVMAILTDIRDTVKKSSLKIELLEAEALGSWRWDKVNGILRLYSLDGQEVALFTTKDSSNEASRERRTDLEAIKP